MPTNIRPEYQVRALTGRYDDNPDLGISAPVAMKLDRVLARAQRGPVPNPEILSDGAGGATISWAQDRDRVEVTVNRAEQFKVVIIRHGRPVEDTGFKDAPAEQLVLRELGQMQRIADQRREPSPGGPYSGADITRMIKKGQYPFGPRIR